VSDVLKTIERMKFEFAVEASVFTGKCPEPKTPEQAAYIDAVAAKWDRYLWDAPDPSAVPLGIHLFGETK
jgi:hypothetical protein